MFSLKKSEEFEMACMFIDDAICLLAFGANFENITFSRMQDIKDYNSAIDATNLT